jgi:predicted lipid-binding transport protein (Tim44 family)
MNNQENVAEVAKYMTPELYQEIREEIMNNNFIADFSNLECQLLNCEMKDNTLIASVRFFGNVSDEPNQSPQPFSEVWNFIKTDLQTGKWLVAGIQQQ